MLIRDETLTWPNARHWLRLMQDEHELLGTFGIIKDGGSQTIPVKFPPAITVDSVLSAWERQSNNWVDLFPPVCSEGAFAVIRSIDLGDYRILWYVYHVRNCPQDACVVLRKPVAPATA